MRSQFFDDFDAFAESVRDVDSKMLLRDTQRPKWFTCSVDLGPIDIQLGRLGSGNIAQGQLRGDGYMLYLPLTPRVEYRANGDVLEKGAFAVLEPGCEFCITTEVAHDWCVAFIPTQLLADIGEPLTAQSRSCFATAPNRRAAAQFRSTVLQIVNNAASYPEFETSPAAVNAMAEVFKVATRIVAPGQFVVPACGRTRLSRRLIIERSMELIEQRIRDPLSVADLAVNGDVSERTLRRIFNQYFGVGPAKYIQLKRLNQIHRALLKADRDETSVTDVALANGEWEMGRLAARYRQLFGELPSETHKKLH